MEPTRQNRKKLRISKNKKKGWKKTDIKDVEDFLDSSPLKPFGQMNRNLVGSIYGKSSVMIAHLLSFGSFVRAVSEEKIFKNLYKR
jgi:hypothetical protein